MKKETIQYKKRFFDFFPTPEFLKMSTVGLAFSDELITMIGLNKKATCYEISTYAEVALQNGIIESGYIKDIPALERILRELKDRKNLTFVRASLPEEKGYIFTMDVPRVSHDQIRNSIEFGLEEQVPMKASEVIFDFKIIPGEKKDNTLDVAVSVWPEKVIEEYVEVLRGAEIEAVAFEVESQAIARAIIGVDEHEAYIIVNLSPKKAGIYIVSQNIVMFTSTISLSVDTIDGEAVEIFLLKEIQKILLFWQTHGNTEMKQSRLVAEVRIVGDHPEWNTITHFIKSELTIHVEIADVWLNTFAIGSYVPEIEKERSRRFAAAVGLALPVSHN